MVPPTSQGCPLPCRWPQGLQMGQTQGKWILQAHHEHWKIEVTMLQLSCMQRWRVQIQGYNTRVSFHMSLQCWTRRKEGRWPLAALGVPQVPGQCQLCPIPCSTWPRGLRFSLLALLSPLSKHKARCLLIQNLENALFHHCSAGKGDTQVFSFSFK